MNSQRTCEMTRILLYDEEGVPGIECLSCGWVDNLDENAPLPSECPKCGSRVANDME